MLRCTFRIGDGNWLPSNLAHDLTHFASVNFALLESNHMCRLVSLLDRAPLHRFLVSLAESCVPLILLFLRKSLLLFLLPVLFNQIFVVICRKVPFVPPDLLAIRLAHSEKLVDFGLQDLFVCDGLFVLVKVIVVSFSMSDYSADRYITFGIGGAVFDPIHLISLLF